MHRGVANAIPTPITKAEITSTNSLCNRYANFMETDQTYDREPSDLADE